MGSFGKFGFACVRDATPVSGFAPRHQFPFGHIPRRASYFEKLFIHMTETRSDSFGQIVSSFQLILRGFFGVFDYKGLDRGSL
jgi:hypothetical protein